MFRPNAWKMILLGAAVTCLGLFGAGAATAQPGALSASTAAVSSTDGSIALPPHGPVAVYPQDQSIGGANPHTPYGTNPYVPYGVWAP